jgi:AbiV family abortive infection protein
MVHDDKQQPSAEELRNAGLKAFRNASELVEEAQLLYEHGHLTRAFFLCCISGEELGKCFISLSAIVNRMAGTFDEKRYMKRFRAHREKTGALTFFENSFVFDLPSELSDMKDSVEAAEKTKLASLYSDFYGVKAHVPSEVIPERLVTMTLAVANDRLKYFAERVRPKFDYVLEIDPAQILALRRELAVISAVRPDAGS